VLKVTLNRELNTEKVKTAQSHPVDVVVDSRHLLAECTMLLVSVLQLKKIYSEIPTN
jgi:hypothetical protein